MLAILAAALALRRAVASAPWGTEAQRARLRRQSPGLLLATNMLEVWQAKYPSSEISAQMLFVGSLLGVVVALTTRWRPAAGMAGLLIGIGFLDRGDGVLLVLLGVAGLAAIIATRRWDGRATWFAVGLAVVLPHAFWQAYSYNAAGRYSAHQQRPLAAEADRRHRGAAGRRLRCFARWAAASSDGRRCAGCRSGSAP